ncbi:MAG: hypothetical protein DRZ76_01725 [Candidatus Nealsonbacteria bacterium]|nr:MAG: hypothetical protein DRZ76_01725 [Candidatus Nealsonbacteria bacterium]
MRLFLLKKQGDKKMKLQERKYTTKQGLKKLRALIDSLAFHADVNSVESEEFFVRIDRNNGYAWGDMHRLDWTNTRGKWRIKKGKINIISIEDNDRENGVVKINEIDQLDFKACLAALENVVEKYNRECEKKDMQIEQFLKFCKNIQTTPDQGQSTPDQATAEDMEWWETEGKK